MDSHALVLHVKPAESVRQILYTRESLAYRRYAAVSVLAVESLR